MLMQENVRRDPQIVPALKKIKDYILDQIQAGNLKNGDAVPAEEELAESFGISKTSVTKALRQLTAEQILVRVRGSGLFVAQEKYQTTLVEIKNISDEIKSRGHFHRSKLCTLERKKAMNPLAHLFGVELGQPLFHSVIVHFENEVPVQIEDRWVNAIIAKDYLEQDFSQITPKEYLMEVAPLQSVQYKVEAVLPPPDIAEMLNISQTQPCLVLKRKRLSQNLVASLATMWHPGDIYQFSGKI